MTGGSAILTSAIGGCLMPSSATRRRVLDLPNPAATGIYTLSLHDALPIWRYDRDVTGGRIDVGTGGLAERGLVSRSEEHTSELQSRRDLVCRLLLEKKNEDTRRPS